jgi:dTDP-4-dehydrorhamnose reductase
MKAKGELELWAGIECSVVRVGDSYVDQIVATGHDVRLDDLERLAGLGVAAVRYPVLWERTAPDGLSRADWSFADERLARLRALGLRPIVGLVHHGSGPRHTSLLDDSFVTGLAAFARAVAERYPWIEDYTPINEPLTTARFSALYGHWYPHATTDATFLRALLVECDATRAAMRAIREVTPHARLVQTEDFATVFSTQHLAYQAWFENLRRFASLDLLTGRFDAGHPLREFFVERGAPPAALDSFVVEPCPPDVIGINYYVTSDRFLDERIHNYPVGVRGGNRKESYADVEAVRVLEEGIVGHRGVLRQMWDRYQLPLAFTEVHLGCTPEEQVRWLAEAWRGAEDARSEGIDVRGVTVWSVFGACDWDSLLVKRRGHYEPGLFDVRGGCVRPTALASVARDLALTGSSTHPMAAAPGWWRRGDRLSYPPIAATPGRTACPRSVGTARSLPPVMITGAAGTLGRALARICETRGMPVIAMSRADLDVANGDAVADAVRQLRPWAVVNAAGYVRVDGAERDRDRCFRENGLAVAALARACAEHGARFATFSSDLVFDGEKNVPYVESDPVAPLGVYGESKALAERIVAELFPRGLVIRTSAFFGPWDEWNFVRIALAKLREGRTVLAATDQVVSPTYVPDLANAVMTLLVDDARGIWHVANAGAVSWADLAARAAEAAGAPTTTLVRCTTAALGLEAARPRFSALSSERGLVLPPLDDALRRFLARTAGALEAAFAETA